MQCFACLGLSSDTSSTWCLGSPQSAARCLSLIVTKCWVNLLVQSITNTCTMYKCELQNNTVSEALNILQCRDDNDSFLCSQYIAVSVTCLPLYDLEVTASASVLPHLISAITTSATASYSGIASAWKNASATSLVTTHADCCGLLKHVYMMQTTVQYTSQLGHLGRRLPWVLICSLL